MSVPPDFQWDERTALMDEWTVLSFLFMAWGHDLRELWGRQGEEPTTMDRPNNPR